VIEELVDHLLLNLKFPEKLKLEFRKDVSKKKLADKELFLRPTYQLLMR